MYDAVQMLIEECYIADTITIFLIILFGYWVSNQTIIC